MPIDPSIPLAYRPAPLDVLGAYEQGQKISQNTNILESQKQQNELQKVLYHDQMLARAAQMGANSPEDWDRAFQELSQTMPDAAQFVGKWHPNAANRLMGRLQAGPQRMAGQRGGITAAAGGSGGIEAAVDDAFVQAKPGQPAAAGIDMQTMTPERALEGYTKLTNAANMLGSGSIQSGEQFRSALIGLSNEMPQIAQVVRDMDAKRAFEGPNWADGLGNLIKNFNAFAEKLRPMAMGQMAGLQMEPAKPGYAAQITEAGPVIQTTPLDRGKPSFEFAPMGGTADPAFQTRFGRGGAGGNVDPTLDEQTLHIMADQYLAGDRTVLQNLGRGVQGSANLVALRAEIAKLAAERGWSGADIARVIGEFEGFKSGQRTMGNRAAAVLMASTEAGKMANLVVSTSAAVDRSQFPNLNAITNAVKRGVGSREVVQFNAALNSFINVYARAIAPTGQGPTVSDKEHAREMLNTAFTHGQVEATLETMLLEIEAAKETPREVKGKFGEFMTPPKEGGPDHDKPPSKPKPAWAP